jgi:hypothetical protein
MARAWSLGELRQLADLVAHRRRAPEIARALKRSEGAVRSKAEKLRLSLRGNAKIGCTEVRVFVPDGVVASLRALAARHGATFPDYLRRCLADDIRPDSSGPRATLRQLEDFGGRIDLLALRREAAALDMPLARYLAQIVEARPALNGRARYSEHRFEMGEARV